MRLGFMGTPDFAVPALRALVGAGHEIVRVYSQPARPAGRGKKLQPSPVAQAAEAINIPVETPQSFKDSDVLAQFSALKLDACVVVAYGQILPQAALDAPRLGCLNIHASLLPRWRGAAPIQRAIMAGDKETGIAIMQMEAGLDTGPVLLEGRTVIGPRTTASELHDRLADMGAALVVEALAGLESGKITPRAQNTDGVTYAKKISKEEARIDWTRPAEALRAHICGLAPFPGAWTMMDGERVKVLMAGINSGAAGADPGTVVAAPLSVACGDGVLDIELVQRAGKKAMSAEEFLKGFPLTPGHRIG